MSRTSGADTAGATEREARAGTEGAGRGPVSEVRATERDEFLALPPEEMADSVRRGPAVPLGLLDRVRLIVTLGRPRTCVPGVLAYALGYAYTGGPPSIRVLLGAVLSFAIGFLANLHNTATDLYEDSHNLPGRVFLVSRLGYRSLLRIAGGIGMAMFLGGLALGPHFAVFMTLAVVGLHQYSAPPVRSKGRPVLGLWVFAQAVVFPFLFGWATAPGSMLSTLLRSLAAPFTGHAPAAEAAFRSYRYLGMWFFLTLWFMAKGTFKNIPDYEGDRAAGVRTSATVFSTRRAAALASLTATVTAYSSLSGLVALGLEEPRVLFSLVWLGPATFNSMRLMTAEHGPRSNRILKTDMLISSGFVATLLLLVAPSSLNLAFVLACTGLLFASDLFGLDSRREVHVRHGDAGEARSVGLTLQTEATIPFPPAAVFAACRDDAAALGRLLPGIRSVEVVSRKEGGGIVETAVAWRGGANVPRALRSLARNAGLEWTDYATWDAAELSVEWYSENEVLGGAIRCSARDVFVHDGRDGTRLVVSGRIAVDRARLPVLFGPFRDAFARRLERYVVADVTASVQRMASALTAHLGDTRQQGAPK